MSRSDADRPDLVRYWFTFEVAHLAPEPGPPGTVILDGGAFAYRYFGHGAGVTGYDEDDCISLIVSTLDGEPVPPVRSKTRDVDVEALDLPRMGVPA